MVNQKDESPLNNPIVFSHVAPWLFEIFSTSDFITLLSNKQRKSPFMQEDNLQICMEKNFFKNEKFTGGDLQQLFYWPRYEVFLLQALKQGMDKELLLKITGYEFDVTQFDTQDITKSIFQQALHMPTEEEKVKALEFALLAKMF